MTASQLESLRKHGLESSGFSLPCIYADCDLKFKFTNPLHTHIRTHGRGLRCPYCGTGWRSLGPLVQHVRVHTKHKPYTCPFPKCTYSTTQKCILKVHLQSHVHQFSLYILSTQYIYSLTMLFIMLCFQKGNVAAVTGVLLVIGTVNFCQKI